MIVSCHLLLFVCFAAFLFGHITEKEQIEDGLLVSPPKTHATYYTIPFSFHRKTITFLCHTKFTNTKNVKKRSSSSPRYLYTYFGAEFRISGQVSTYIAIRIYCIYMSMSIVIEYELMLGRWMFTSSFSYFLQCAQTSLGTGCLPGPHFLALLPLHSRVRSRSGSRLECSVSRLI